MSSKGSKGSKDKKEPSPRGATRRSALKSASRKGDTTRRAHIDDGRNKETLFRGRPTDAEIPQLWQTDYEFGLAKRERDREQKLAKGELQSRRDKERRRNTISQHHRRASQTANKEVAARVKVLRDAAQKGMSKQLYRDVAREAANRAATGPGLRSIHSPRRTPRRSHRSASRQDGFIVLRRQPSVVAERQQEQPIQSRSMFKTAYDFLTNPFTRRRGGKVHRNTRKNKKSKGRK
jgi:hypothetical protein